MVALAAEIFLPVVLGGLVVVAVRVLDALVWRPRRIRSCLRRQGIGGPAPSSFLLGNIPDMKRIAIGKQQGGAAKPAGMGPQPKQEELRTVLSHSWPSVLFPHLEQWRNEHGPLFMYSMGNIHLLSVTDAEMVKELSSCTSLSLGKPSYLTKDRGPLLGEGIISSSGSLWAHQRKIIAPELYPDKVKGMLSLMVESTNLLLSSWESKIEEAEGGSAEINIDGDLRSFSADIISRSCFRSSYSHVKEIFLKLRQLQKVMSKGSIGVPGLRYVPTKENREMWKLEKEIRLKILEVVKLRNEVPDEKDLLQMILEGAKGFGENESLPSHISLDRFIVDNCKNIYFAGHETTAITASWSLVLLAAYPEWQDRARNEVLAVLGDDQIIDSNKLRGLKILNTVIQETLRLYPPASFVVREAHNNFEFKNIFIQKGLVIQVPVPILHQDPKIWGPDAMEFNPGRFSDGISGACSFPQAYIPFGLGPRTCAGHHFAMVELKVILSLILSRFRFSLSRSYKHSPAFRLVIEPGDGVTLCMSKL